MDAQTQAPFDSQQTQPIQPRLVAVKSDIGGLIHGSYFEVSGKWEPDYLITPEGERVSRVNLVGMIVALYFSEDGNYGAATLDDGTETIRLKSFKGDVKSLKELKIGDIVAVIGKVRKFRDEVYIAPETIAPSDPDREILRKLELARTKRKLKALKELVDKTSSEFDEPQKLIDFLSTKYGFSKETVEAVLLSRSATPAAPAGGLPEEAAAEEASESNKSSANPKAKTSVLSAIEGAGSQGLEYSAILRTTGLTAAEIDSAIKELISEGEIFEPRSGRFKRLV